MIKVMFWQKRLLFLFFLFFFLVFPQQIFAIDADCVERHYNYGEQLPSVYFEKQDDCLRWHSKVTPTLTPSEPVRPDTELACNGKGSWFGGVCYLYEEVLPGGDFIVVPPYTMGNYSYPIFGKVEDYNSYLTQNEKAGNQNENSKFDNSSSSENSSNEYNNGVTSVSLYSQLDPRWANIYISETVVNEQRKEVSFGNVGCGPTSVAMIAKKSPGEIVGKYEKGTDITAKGTSITANAKVLNNLGYKVDTGVNKNGALEQEMHDAHVNNDYSELLTDVDKYMDKGWSTIIGGNFGNLNGGAHWAVVVAADPEKNTVTVADPNGGIVREYNLGREGQNFNGNSANDDTIYPDQLLFAKKEED